ncbi:MAG: hypothetical protein AAGM38_09240 [Pseudomonadota bacterium]
MNGRQGMDRRDARLRAAAPMALAAVFLVVAGGVAAAADAYRFTWLGADGYRIEGAFALREGAGQAVARGRDVLCFEIHGFKGEAPLGSWGLGALEPDSAWGFGFDRNARRFLVGGLSYGPNGQQWNMFGDGSGCGDGGFGFNAGSAGQDVCVDDRMRVASRIAPATPLAATPDPSAEFGPAACRRSNLVS